MGKPASVDTYTKWMIVGTVAIVLLLLFLLVISDGTNRSNSTVSSVPPPENPTPLGGTLLPTDDQLRSPLAGQIRSLRESVENLSGKAKLDAWRKIVTAFELGGYPGNAAVESEEIASLTKTAADWTLTGHLYYKWMLTLEDPFQIIAARKAISSYQTVLDLEPQNHDVRLDMAAAYQFDPESFAQALVQTDRVLDQEPDNPRAHFNKGLFLSRLNRLSEARVHFARVTELTEAGQPLRTRAEEYIQKVDTELASR